MSLLYRLIQEHQNCVFSPLLYIGNSLVILSLSGKITVVKSWFVIIGDDFIRAGSTNFNYCEEIPSKP